MVKTIDDKLLNNYKNTLYQFTIFSKEICIKIGQINSDIDHILRKNNWENYSIISAFNPKSIIYPEQENLFRHKKLLSVAKDYTFFKGLNRAKDPNWNEKSILIFDISLEQVKKIAERFEQLAIVYGSNSKKAELLFI